MDYKNFSLRIFISLIFIFIYSICLFINFGLVFYLIIIIYILVLLEIIVYFKKYKLIPIIYILISFFFMLNINFNQEFFYIFNLFVSIVIIFDVFSYFVGKLYGKNKLIKISPNKTIEGLFGGIFFSFLSSLIFAYYIDLKIDIILISFIILIQFTAFSGDIIESVYKRKNNLKDSSEFLPGHGGVFDRFDSFLFSIIFYSIFIKFYL